MSSILIKASKISSFSSEIAWSSKTLIFINHDLIKKIDHTLDILKHAVQEIDLYFKSQINLRTDLLSLFDARRH